MKSWFGVFLLAAVGAAPQAGPPAACEVLVPVLEAGRPVVAAASGQSYPVLRSAPAGPLLEKIRRELRESFARKALVLDRFARTLAQSGPAGPPPDLPPMYLLTSNEEGGFSRFGFWLQDAAGNSKLILAGYVDLVVDDRSVASGDFEEIFSHELGHLILKSLTGGLPEGRSRKMHQSMTVTDYPTAFDEGFAEHFQPLVRDATANPALRRLAAGTTPTDFESLWLSAADGQLRTDGVKRNLFIHRKPWPAGIFDPPPDLYGLFLESETSTAFLNSQLKNGQEMMASEGVISTLFYRLVNDPKLREAFREPAFYRQFSLPAAASPRQALTPYENINLKLFAAMRKLRGRNLSSPPMIALIEEYGKLFPDEARRAVQIFLETTWGATASQSVAAALQHAARDGLRGDIAAYRADRPFPLLDGLIADVAAGKVALDANLGPEIWIRNEGFHIAPAAWNPDRTETLTMNLNTAGIVEFMTLPGVDFALARRILAARDARGFFRSIEDLGDAGSPAPVVERIRGMQIP